MIKKEVVIFIFAISVSMKCSSISDEINSQVAELNSRIQQQIFDINSDIQEQIGKQVRLANQGARSSISASLNNVINQIDEKKQSIKEIDNGTYNKPTVLFYNGNRAYFNGEYFTRGRNGRRLNEEETKVAWAALRRGLQKSLNSLSRAKQNLEITMNRFE